MFTSEQIDNLTLRAMGLWDDWAEFAQDFVDEGVSDQERQVRSLIVKGIMIGACHQGAEYRALSTSDLMVLGSAIAATVTMIDEKEAELTARDIVHDLIAGHLGRSEN